ncbi:GrpB family protein [Halobacillus litoralis]|uniref:GrpB family protein n=1 Tax=Halobacillus litoralis TaxID=45668 RepID=UPI001CD79FDF|nr:GrpB family protein [Halobacillus litoralis]MCA1022348.1 GrpB family protein [Halobacillus litoralis]
MRKVEVVAYDQNWPSLFEQERRRLEKIFGSVLVAVHHIGSTAVPGLAAKPVIDLLPVVSDLTAVDAVTAEVVEAGYEAKGENGLPGRRFFQKGGENRTHHVHVFEAGSPEIKRHLVFRDYLRTHDEERGAYGRLKIQLAEEHPYDMDAYIKGKHGCVRRLEQAAWVWSRP